MTLGTRPFTAELHDLGGGNWAWLQPDGGWGWSNAGLIVDEEAALLPAAEIITSVAAAEEMTHESPETMVALLAAAPDMGITGEFFTHCFGSFAFEGIDRPPPTTTCSSRVTRSSGREAFPTRCAPSSAATAKAAIASIAKCRSPTRQPTWRSIAGRSGANPSGS